MTLLQNILLRSTMAIAISAGCALHVAVQAAGTEIATVDVQRGSAMKEQGALLLDVREPGEYEQGHAPGSTLIPLGQLAERMQEIRSYSTKPVAVICRSGRRSAVAADILNRAGFTKVYNVQGGMNAWEAANLPVVKGTR